MSLSADQQKKMIVVLGMPRSGTSAITCGLQALGIDLGKKFAKPDMAWNPKGFWEDTDIVYKINRGVLFALNHDWMSVSLIDPGHFKQACLDHLKQDAVTLIEQRMANTDYWGFKDPRTAKILPFWQDVFSRLYLKDKYIITLRNPLSSAYSYHRLSGIDIEVGLLLWLMHLVPAIQGTQGKERVMVSYDMMMQNPHVQLERIQRRLNLPILSDSSEKNKYVDEFLDKTLRHYEYSMDDLVSHSATAISPFCVKMYQLFMQIAKDEIAFDSDVFLLEWQTLMQEFNPIYLIYSYIDVLLKKNKRLEKNILSLKKSIPWRLVYPLRIIDDFLRDKRKKARERLRLVKSYE